MLGLPGNGVTTLPDTCRTTELANPSPCNLEYGEHFILGIWCRPGKLDVIRRQAHSSSEARGCSSIERAERHTWNARNQVAPDSIFYMRSPTHELETKLSGSISRRPRQVLQRISPSGRRFYINYGVLPGGTQGKHVEPSPIFLGGTCTRLRGIASPR